MGLDPEGRAGSYAEDDLEARVTYTEGAEYELGRMAAGFGGQETNPAPLLAFIKKYPASPLVRNAYLYVSFYYGTEGTREEAAKFFEEYTGRYPDDRDALARHIRRIIRDKEPLDKGIVLAEKLKRLQGYPLNPANYQNLAELYILKGDAAKGEDEYGQEFIANYLTGVRLMLTNYADFWIAQNRNLDSVEAIADLVIKIAPDSQWDSLQRLAHVYLKLGKPEKALAAYGPEFVKRVGDDAEALGFYASFWSRQGDKQAGMNLDSALGAARRAVELVPDFSNDFALAGVLFKLKRYQEALPFAEKAVDLAKLQAANFAGFPVKQYEKLVRDIKDALAKAEAKK